MNKQHNSRNQRITIAVILALYFLIILLGSFIVWLIPTYKNKDELLNMALEKGLQTLYQRQETEPLMLNGMEHLLFTEDGREIFIEVQFLSGNQRERFKEYLPDLFEDGIMFTPILVQLNRGGGSSRSVPAVAAGVVFEVSSGRRFASILVRDYDNFDVNVATFVALFTIVYIVGIIFTLHTIRKERELNRMRRDLIANVSHELKTPITAIRAMAEVLHDGLLKDEESHRTYCAGILQETDRLTQLVQDILELSRFQSKRVEFKKNHVRADSFIPAVVDQYMMLCSDTGIILDTSGLNLTAVPVLCTDEDKLVTLMTILLDNAVKFTGKGGRIWLSSQIHSKYTVFCVRDNGPGIRDEDLERVFDRFYKTDIAHNSMGSGLGLAIADEIAKGLGEKLWVESKFGVGSAFYFTVSY